MNRHMFLLTLLALWIWQAAGVEIDTVVEYGWIELSYSELDWNRLYLML